MPLALAPGRRLFQYEWAALLALLVLPRFLPPAAVHWLQLGGGIVRRALGWPVVALHRTSLIAGLWYPQAGAQTPCTITLRSLASHVRAAAISGVCTWLSAAMSGLFSMH